MVPCVMPAFPSASSLIRKWVVLAGWITSDRQSPTLARWLNSFRASMNVLPCSRSPFMSKLKTDPAPFGSSRCARAWLGCDSSIGWPTREMKGCALRNSTTLAVLLM